MDLIFLSWRQEIIRRHLPDLKQSNLAENQISYLLCNLNISLYDHDSKHNLGHEIWLIASMKVNSLPLARHASVSAAKQHHCRASVTQPLSVTAQRTHFPSPKWIWTRKNTEKPRKVRMGLWSVPSRCSGLLLPVPLSQGGPFPGLQFSRENKLQLGPGCVQHLEQVECFCSAENPFIQEVFWRFGLAFLSLV